MDFVDKMDLVDGVSGWEGMGRNYFLLCPQDPSCPHSPSLFSSTVTPS
jgi:hypothetical protein